MNKTEPNAVALPLSLKMLAWFLIVVGASSLVAGAVSLISGILGHEFFICTLNLVDGFTVFAGLGLLRRESFWRSLILAYCWIAFIIAPLMCAYALINRDSGFQFNLLGIHSDGRGNPAFICLGTAFIIINYVIIYRILVSKPVSACFPR